MPVIVERTGWLGPLRPPQSLLIQAAPSGRYLQRSTGEPFQIHGSSTWCLVQSSKPEVRFILDNIKGKRFNSILLMSALSESALTQYGPAQAEGLSPFLDSKLTPNPAFWAHVEFIVQEAAARGLVVQLAFLYLGHGSAEDGFRARVAGCTLGECTAFGNFLGNLFKRHQNIIYVCGGDNLSNWSSNWDAMVAGIVSQDPSHLITGHPSRGQEGRQFGSFITLNSSYRNRAEIASGTLLAYQGTPTLPVYLFEGQYEGDGSYFSNPTLNAMETRIQSWQALLAGGCGANYGNHPVWSNGYVSTNVGVTPPQLVYPTWLSTEGLDSEGHGDMVHLHNFFDDPDLPWWTLVPDASSSFVTAGRSSNENYVAAAYSPGGDLAIAVIPAGGLITVNLSIFPAAMDAWYYDPTSGARSYIARYSNSGSQNFDPPLNAAGDTDMILLLKRAA